MKLMRESRSNSLSAFARTSRGIFALRIAS
jgi:hypothetical protein